VIESFVHSCYVVRLIQPPIRDDCSFPRLFQFSVHNTNHFRSQDSSVNTVTSLRGGRLRNLVSMPRRDKGFSLLQGVQTGSGANSVLYSVGTGDSPRGYSGRGVELSTHFIKSEVKKHWSYICISWHVLVLIIVPPGTI
jgi:hypothetical protein